MQASVQDQACGDAGQEGVPACSRPGPGEENVEGHFVGVVGVGRDRGLFDLPFPYAGGISAVGERCGEVR